MVLPPSIHKFQSVPFNPSSWPSSYERYFHVTNVGFTKDAVCVAPSRADTLAWSTPASAVIAASSVMLALSISPSRTLEEEALTMVDWSLLGSEYSLPSNIPSMIWFGGLNTWSTYMAGLCARAYSVHAYSKSIEIDSSWLHVLLRRPPPIPFPFLCMGTAVLLPFWWNGMKTSPFWLLL